MFLFYHTFLLLFSPSALISSAYFLYYFPPVHFLLDFPFQANVLFLSNFLIYFPIIVNFLLLNIFLVYSFLSLYFLLQFPFHYKLSIVLVFQYTVFLTFLSIISPTSFFISSIFFSSIILSHSLSSHIKRVPSVISSNILSFFFPVQYILFFQNSTFFYIFLVTFSWNKSSFSISSSRILS